MVPQTTIFKIFFLQSTQMTEKKKHNFSIWTAIEIQLHSLNQEIKND